MKNQILLSIIATTTCFTHVCMTSIVPENVLTRANQNNAIRLFEPLTKREVEKEEENQDEDEMAQELNELEKDATSYIELGEDKWVGFLARASPSHFERIVKKVKHLLGKDDCEDEDKEEEEDNNAENPENGQDNGEEDNGEEEDCEEDEEEDYEEDEEEENVDEITGNGKRQHLDWGVFAASATNRTKPLGEFLVGLQHYAEKQDPQKVLKKAGLFSMSEFDSETTTELRNGSLSEKINAGDVKNKQIKKWLASTAARRAKIIKDAVSNDKFNDSAVFEAEEFQYRKGNIFLDDDDNDDFSSGCGCLFKEYTLLEVISVTAVSILMII